VETMLQLKMDPDGSDTLSFRTIQRHLNRYSQSLPEIFKVRSAAEAFVKLHKHQFSG